MHTSSISVHALYKGTGAMCLSVACTGVYYSLVGLGKGQTEVLKTRKMGPVRKRHYSHLFATQSSHFVDRAGWQAKMASIGFWTPCRDARKPHLVQKHIQCVLPTVSACAMAPMQIWPLSIAGNARGPQRWEFPISYMHKGKWTRRHFSSEIMNKHHYLISCFRRA